MITLDDNARKAIDNARAFSVTMIEQGWGTVHVSSAHCEIFLTRGEGKIDPLSPAPVAAAVAAPAAVVADPAPVTVSVLPAVAVTAPHVATVVSLAPVGSFVQAGQPVATLRVLDDTSEIAAPADGAIESHGVLTGELAEYGTRLVTLRP